MRSTLWECDWHPRILAGEPFAEVYFGGHDGDFKKNPTLSKRDLAELPNRVARTLATAEHRTRGGSRISIHKLKTQPDMAGDSASREAPRPLLFGLPAGQASQRDQGKNAIEESHRDATVGSAQP